mgnify:FL=1
MGSIDVGKQANLRILEIRWTDYWFMGQPCVVTKGGQTVHGIAESFKLRSRTVQSAWWQAYRLAETPLSYVAQH